MFQRRAAVIAVAGVSLSIPQGKTLALVGESGSGKSTTARAICGLIPYQGEVLFSGVDARRLERDGSEARYRQMIFQDPYSSLDPLMTVGESISEPMHLLERHAADVGARVARLLDSVRLPLAYASRLPSELSGGQRQRVAIARALATEPTLVICDEALSALDTSTQAEVLTILRELRDEHGLSFLFIAHDLAVVRSLADQIAVMYLGSIVETGPTEAVFREPKHPYTQALLESAPIPHPRLQRARRRLSIVRGEPPDPSRRPDGCAFHPRGPLAIEMCRTVAPELESAGLRAVSCHVNKAKDAARPQSAFSERDGSAQIMNMAR
jgi:oligopeptide/dipeptide ABC transporter ATP-binding protein